MSRRIADEETAAAHRTDGAVLPLDPKVVGLRRVLGRRRIASYKLTVTFIDGDRRLMGIAYRKARGAV